MNKHLCLKRSNFQKYPSLFPSSVRSFKYQYFKYKKLSGDESPHQKIPSNKNTYSYHKDIFPVFDPKEFLSCYSSQYQHNKNIDILRSKIPIKKNKLRNALTQSKYFNKSQYTLYDTHLMSNNNNISNEDVRKISHRKDCSTLVRKMLCNEYNYNDELFTNRNKMYFKSDKPLNFYDKL